MSPGTNPHYIFQALNLGLRNLETKCFWKWKKHIHTTCNIIRGQRVMTEGGSEVEWENEVNECPNKASYRQMKIECYSCHKAAGHGEF